VRTALSFPAAALIYLYLAFHGMLPAEWNRPFLMTVYATEVFLIVLNIYSSVVYTRTYWPYMMRALQSK